MGQQTTVSQEKDIRCGHIYTRLEFGWEVSQLWWGQTHIVIIKTNNINTGRFGLNLRRWMTTETSSFDTHSSSKTYSIAEYWAQTEINNVRNGLSSSVLQRFQVVFGPARTCQGGEGEPASQQEEDWNGTSHDIRIVCKWLNVWATHMRNFFVVR